MDFDGLLTTLRIGRGDVLYLHSSFSRLKTFKLSAQQIIEKVIDRISPEGCLSMPSFTWNILPGERPWMGYAVFFSDPPIFDLLNTPCNIGWLPEQFRLLSETKRGLHGIWPVCALGPLAEYVTANQHEIIHPYGPGSSFRILLDADVKILGLGVTLNTTSLCPIVDYELGEAASPFIFTNTPKKMVVIDSNGRSILTRSHTMVPEAVKSIKPIRCFELSRRLQDETIFVSNEDTFFFSYRARIYHEEALRLGKYALSAGISLPWLEQFSLI